MKKLYKYINIIVLVIFLIGCTNDKKLSTFDSGSISYGEFKRYFNVLDDSKKKEYKDYEDYFNLLRRLSLQKILTEKSKESGLINNAELQGEYKDISQKIAYNMLQKKMVDDKVKIHQADYSMYKKQYTLYQIVKKTDTLVDERINESKKQLNSIRKTIKSLDDFKAAAKKYSDDITANDGGYIGNVKVGEMEDEIDIVLKTLPHITCSEIIETNVGLHLIMISGTVDISIDELISDAELNETIYNKKMLEIEENWYKQLLKDKDLRINKEIIKERKYDESIVITYKDKTITRDKFFKTADELTKSISINPSYSDLLTLADNLSLDLILSNKIIDPSITKSMKYNTIMEFAYYDLVSKHYVSDTVKDFAPSKKQISDFYKENLNDMFTFELKGGTIFVQPLNEVEEMIYQKLYDQNANIARYNFYRSTIDESNFKTNEKLLKKFIKEVSQY